MPDTQIEVFAYVERLAMILHDSKDVRALAYPQFDAPWVLSYLEIAGMISMEATPRTAEGDEIAKNIIRLCEEKGNEPSPCEFLAYRGSLFGTDIDVWVTEPEENTLLCGPAYLNEVVVHEGSLSAIPRDKKWESVFEEGVPTGIRFVDALAAFAAHRIEEAAERGEIDNNPCEVKAKIVRGGMDINIKIDEMAMRYVTSKKKKIDIKGHIFITVVAKKV